MPMPMLMLIPMPMLMLQGMMMYLNVCGVLLKDFAEHSLRMSKLLKDAVCGAIDERSRPNIYLTSRNTRKDALARELALRDGVDIARDLNPAHNTMFSTFLAPYYWSVYQSEWATDIMFRDHDCLARIYPSLVHHGIKSFASPDVMRFLGQKVPAHGHVHRQFQGEVISDLKHRPEGTVSNID